MLPSTVRCQVPRRSRHAELATRAGDAGPAMDRNGRAACFSAGSAGLWCHDHQCRHREPAQRPHHDWHPEGLRCALLVPRSKLAGTLRVSGEIRSAKPTPMPVLSKPISGRRILLVEDESLIAMAMEETLTDLGFAVVGPISSQAKAVAAAQRKSSTVRSST